MNANRIAEAAFGSLGVDRMMSLMAVIDHGGFSAAAITLGKSQSRISVHVAEIERMLGATLIDRTTRPVRATESGRALAEHLRRAFDQVRAGVEHVDALQKLDEGEVRIGSDSSTAVSFLAKAVHGFQRDYPGVHVAVMEASSSEIDLALANREVGLSIRGSAPRIRVPGIRCRILWCERIALVVPADEDPPLGRSEDIRAYVGTRTAIAFGVSPSANVLTRHTDADGEDALSELAASSRRVAHTTNPLALVEMVRAGLGIGVASSLDLLGVDLSGVRVLRIENEGARREALLCWRASGQLSVAERKLRDVLMTAPIPPSTSSARPG